MNKFEDISLEELRNEIIQFNNDVNVQKLANLYNSKSYSEIIGVSRKELAHSNFIGWLLAENESHALNQLPIQKFLELLVIHAKEVQLKNNKELFDAIIVSDYELSNVEVQTEIGIGNMGRVDILIKSKIAYSGELRDLTIVIENKVGTLEHSDQTTKYFNYFNLNRTSKEIVLYVYLTPISGLELSELKEPECSCKEFIQINYQALADYLLDPIIRKDIPITTKAIITEYLQSLSQPTLDREEDEYKQGLIMALGTDERSLLTKFWEKNQKLILAALYAISSDPEQEEETRASATSAIDKLANSGKDRSLYSISFNGVLEAEKIKKSDIGFSTVSILEKYNLINDSIIKFLRMDRTSNFQLLKKLEEVTENEKKYGKYRVNADPELFYNGIGYFVARNWGKNNTERFTNKMSEKFKGLEYQKF